MRFLSNCNNVYNNTQTVKPGKQVVTFKVLLHIGMQCREIVESSDGKYYVTNWILCNPTCALYSYIHLLI
jgi:hypothetical protein